MATNAPQAEGGGMPLSQLLRSIGSQIERIEFNETHSLSPPDVNTLPAELMVKVFRELQEDIEAFVDGPIDGTPLREDFSSPLSDFLEAYTAVCRRWRQIAISTPVLWRNIFLDRVGPGRPALARIFIERSKQYHTRIFYDFNRPYAEQEQDREELENLCQSASLSRLEWLAITIPKQDADLHPVLTLLKQPLKSLRSLTIDGLTSDDSDEVMQRLQSLDAPKLKKLSLKRFEDISDFKFPGITHFALISLEKSLLSSDSRSLFRILLTMPALEVLIIDEAVPKIRNIEVAIVSLPRLRLLKLKQIRLHENAPFGLLSHLKIPRNTQIEWHRDMHPYLPPLAETIDHVTSLLLTGSGDMDSVRGHCMTTNHTGLSKLFMEVGFPNIRFLAKSGVPCDDYDWATRMPGIEELHVDASMVSRNLFFDIETERIFAYPNLVTLVLWRKKGGALFDPSDESKIIHEIREGLKATKRLTRARGDSINYNIELRDFHGSDSFTLDWMIGQTSHR